MNGKPLDLRPWLQKHDLSVGEGARVLCVSVVTLKEIIARGHTLQASTFRKLVKRMSDLDNSERFLSVGAEVYTSWGLGIGGVTGEDSFDVEVQKVLDQFIEQGLVRKVGADKYQYIGPATQNRL